MAQMRIGSCHVLAVFLRLLSACCQGSQGLAWCAAREVGCVCAGAGTGSLFVRQAWNTAKEEWESVHQCTCFSESSFPVFFLRMLIVCQTEEMPGTRYQSGSGCSVPSCMYTVNEPPAPLAGGELSCISLWLQKSAKANSPWLQGSWGKGRRASNHTVYWSDIWEIKFTNLHMD